MNLTTNTIKEGFDWIARFKAKVSTSPLTSAQKKSHLDRANALEAVFDKGRIELAAKARTERSRELLNLSPLGRSAAKTKTL
jgi:hypothetical protein